jgi:hypothetical protein
MLSARRGGGWREDGITIIVKFYERKESSEILSSMTCSIALRNNFKCRVCDESFHQALEMEEEEAEDRQPEMETKFSPVLSFKKTKLFITHIHLPSSSALLRFYSTTK